MDKLNVLVVESNFLVREGLVSYLKKKGLSVFTSTFSLSEISATLEREKIHVLILDYFSTHKNSSLAFELITQLRHCPTLGIIEEIETSVIKRGLEAGLSGHVLKDCDGDEIYDAVTALHQGIPFYCGQIVEALNDFKGEHLGCDGIQISEREVEIISMIAEGLTNKEIADRLFLSTHTITTHRKNIMNKLGVNNTAGIVLFAVKSNFISPNRFLFANPSE